MHKIIVEHECGCFRRSNLQNNLELDSKDDALLQALNMKDEMNTTFCGKHDFQVLENAQDFVITFKQATHSHASGGCCGGACSSH